MHACWCGNADFLPFGPEYGECRTCGTLVYLKEVLPEQLLVRDDETGFYGKKYWLERQQDAFGYADIYRRARNDLTERNLYWLKVLLKYRLPPGEALEVGCAHGSFVALMEQAGYEAAGVELSPWVVSYGQRTFGIRVYNGSIESLDLPRSSLDIIALMDVLEHLPDPMTTMRCCLELLKPDGLLLIQTPQFKEGMRYEALVEAKDRFLEMLIPDEHLYLFSERSVIDFFGRLGAEYIQFESAIFAHYDMFFVVSRAPLKTHTPDEVESALLVTPNGRLALAMLDLRERELNLVRRRGDLESDSEMRGEQIASLTMLVREREAQLTRLDRQVRELNDQLQRSEVDRAARAEQIVELTEQLQTLQADYAVRGRQIVDLTELVEERERQLTALDGQVRELNAMLRESEADRAARAEQIADLTELVEERERQLTALDGQARELNAMLRESEVDRAARAEQIADLTELAKERERQLTALDGQIRELNVMLRESEADRAARAEQIVSLTTWLDEANIDRQARGQQIQELTMMVQDREQRLAILDRQIQELNRLA